MTEVQASILIQAVEGLNQRIVQLIGLTESQAYVIEALSIHLRGGIGMVVAMLACWLLVKEVFR